MNLGDAASLFLSNLADGRRAAASTVAAYRGDIGAFRRWLDEQGLPTEVDLIRPEHVESYAASCRDVCASTLRRRLDALASLFAFLAKRELVSRNPLASVDRPRCPRPEPRYLTDEHLAKLLEVVRDSRERAILLCLALLGLRRGELLSLDRGDVDLDAQRIVVRHAKGGKSRVLPIPAGLLPALREYAAGCSDGSSAPLFRGRYGGRLSRSALDRLFKRWLREAGLQHEGLTLHSCRHGAATAWLQAGLAIHEVRTLLGHSSLSSTERYVHSELDEIARKLQYHSLPARAAPASDDPRIPDGWRDVLSRLTSEQSASLLALVQQMAGAPASRASPGNGRGRGPP